MGENSLLADIFNKRYTHLKKIVYIHTTLTKQSKELKYSYLFY